MDAYQQPMALLDGYPKKNQIGKIPVIMAASPP